MKVQATMTGSGLFIMNCPDELTPLIESARYIILDMLHMAPRAVLRARPVQIGRLTITFLAYGEVVVSGRLPDTVNIARERHAIIRSYERLKRRLPAMVAAEEADRKALYQAAAALYLSGGSTHSDVITGALEIALTIAAESLSQRGIRRLFSPYCEMNTMRPIVDGPYGSALANSWCGVAEQLVSGLHLPARALRGILETLLHATQLARSLRWVDCRALIIPAEEGAHAH